MSNQFKHKPVSAVIGTAFFVSLGSSPIVNAADNPFAVVELTHGYMVAEHDAEGKCGEGKCGAEKKAAEEKKAEGKCGEGKCGANKDK